MSQRLLAVSIGRTSNVPHSKHQAVPTDRNHYSPPSWMTIEFTVASEVRRNISPSLITTCFAESCPGSQFLRRGFWSGQFSVRQKCNIHIPSAQQNGRTPLAKSKHYHHVLRSEINGLTSFNFLSKDGDPTPSHPAEIHQIFYFLHSGKRSHHKANLLPSNSQNQNEILLNHLIWKYNNRKRQNWIVLGPKFRKENMFITNILVNKKWTLLSNIYSRSSQVLSCAQWVISKW